MKPKLRLIPTEVWVDVFCYPWISRKKLGRIVDRFRNAYFVEILQYCLHGRGKRTLGVMRLDNETPMPDNIKYFESIKISHFDSRTIDFLRRINTLFTGVNLTFDDLPPRTILDHLSPLIHGIHSMSFLRCSIPQMEQSFGPKLAQVKMLKLVFLDPPIQQTTINFFMNWLTSEEQREPRYLELDIPSEDFQQFIVAIQEQFHSAKTMSTFAIHFSQFGAIPLLISIWRTALASSCVVNSIPMDLGLFKSTVINQMPATHCKNGLKKLIRNLADPVAFIFFPI